jgi:hypothetical protein
MDQETVVSIHNGILCSHEEEQNVIIRQITIFINSTNIEMKESQV